MDGLQQQDVPYGNDWDSAAEAAAHGEAADLARPWRSEIRDHIAARVATLAKGVRVLELVPGLLLVCDHLPFDDSARSKALYMTEPEQLSSLTDAGFAGVRIELSLNGLVLYARERAP